MSVSLDGLALGERERSSRNPWSTDSRWLPSKDDLPAAVRADLSRLESRLRKSLRHTSLLGERSAPRSRSGSRSLEHRLLQRTSMGWNLALQQLVESVGWRDYLEQQLHPQDVDDQGLEQQLLEALPSLSMTPFERAVTYGDGDEAVPFFHLVIATLLRQLYSPRQLFERMVVFWSDHFNISFFSDFGIFFKPTDDLEVIRRHALGKFPDLLRASARSPAMLDYLTNDSNVKGHPNENYARELMELHSLGVDGGYGETDVKEVARALTGWGFAGPETGPSFGQFRFREADHDRGSKQVLGRVLPADRGIEDGEDVLEELGRHPATARFVAAKLLRYFWGYLPREHTVDAVAEVFLETGARTDRPVSRQIPGVVIAHVDQQLHTSHVPCNGAATVKIDEGKEPAKAQVTGRDHVGVAKVDDRVAVRVCIRDMNRSCLLAVHMESHPV